MEVHGQLGPGFLEKAYQEAFGLELEARGIAYEAEVRIPLYYKGQRLATVYRADLMVGNILVELKAVASMGRVEEAQLLHYLRATKLKTGLLLNFGSTSLGIRRMTNRGSPKSPESLFRPEGVRAS
jgi:GxxExxY protein